MHLAKHYCEDIFSDISEILEWLFVIMDMDGRSVDSSCDDQHTSSATTKKRKVHRRMRAVINKLRLASHQRGENCLSKRFQYFDIVSKQERDWIIKEFNDLDSYEKQNDYLGDLITVLPI